MATAIRPELSPKNKYWISKHRHYELKHFCLQYNSWKQMYNSLDSVYVATSLWDRLRPYSNAPSDPTAQQALLRKSYLEKIALIEDTAKATDKYLWQYILKAVTEGLSYSHLRLQLGMPCGRDMYYDRYRKFFWLLSFARD